MNDRFKSKWALPGITAAVVASALAFSALAQHEHGGDKGAEAGPGGGHASHGGGGGEGGKGDHGGGGKGGHGGHGGKGMHHRPGMVHQMCPGEGDMPPHYCEPSYKVMSSVKGVQVSAVAPAGDQEVMVTLHEVNAMAPGVNQAIIIVAGSGDLAGGVTVNGGWRQTTTVHLRLQGDGSIYGQGSMHLHVFPLTGP